MMAQREIKLFYKQIEALKRLRDNTTNEVLYGGGSRGGKSWLGNTWIMMETFQKPESAWFVGRDTFTALRKTTLSTFFKVIKAYGVSDCFEYNGSTHEMFNKKTGSMIHFGEIGWFPSDPEYDRIGSMDLSGSFIDECQQVKKKGIDVLRGRYSVLEGDGWKTIPKSFYSCNPAKNWIFSDFVKPFDNGTLPHDKAFIKSLVTDNPHVTQDYIDNLKKSDQVTIERLIYGNFYYDDDPSKLCEYDKITDLWSNTYVEQGKKYITADLATKGSDKFVVGYWNGFRLEYIFTESKSTGKGIIDKIGELCTRFQVPASNVVYDADGLGQGLSGFTRYYEFHNGAKAKNGENYFNLKSQCYYKLADKVNEGQLYISQEDHRDEIVEELEQVKRDKMDEDGKLRLIPKKDIKERIGRSPDFTDMMAMRMYFELSSGVQAFNPDFF
jgi:phage terminase large subunit